MSRTQNPNLSEYAEIQKVGISRYDDIRFCFYGTLEDSVIIWVFAHHTELMARKDHITYSVQLLHDLKGCIA